MMLSYIAFVFGKVSEEHGFFSQKRASLIVEKDLSFDSLLCGAQEWSIGCREERSRSTEASTERPRQLSP
jgi:hypothetical protein